MALFSPEESKAVGFKGPVMEQFPTQFEVANSSRLELVRWFRFLRSPRSDAEVDVLHAINERLIRTFEFPVPANNYLSLR